VPSECLKIPRSAWSRVVHEQSSWMRQARQGVQSAATMRIQVKACPVTARAITLSDIDHQGEQQVQEVQEVQGFESREAGRVRRRVV
jgi:hypothetical protein